MDKEIESSELHSRLEKIGTQDTLFGKPIALTQFKNLAQKRELKEKVKAMFNGEIFRSVITPREVDNNLRLDKLLSIINPAGSTEYSANGSGCNSLLFMLWLKIDIS